MTQEMKAKRVKSPRTLHAFFTCLSHIIKMSNNKNAVSNALPKAARIVMTKAEVLEALKKMTTKDRLEVIETASKLIREEIAISSQISSHQELSLAEAAERMRAFYEQGSELVVFADQEIEDFYEYEDYA
jgi:hypothetical protein